jgi:hypothetical protein
MVRQNKLLVPKVNSNSLKERVPPRKERLLPKPENNLVSLVSLVKEINPDSLDKINLVNLDNNLLVKATNLAKLGNNLLVKEINPDSLDKINLDNLDNNLLVKATNLVKAINLVNKVVEANKEQVSMKQ